MTRYLLILLGVSVGWGGDIIDPDRRVEWSTNTCGIPGGIPVRVAANPALNPGDDVQAALDSCASNGVVLLNPGTYNVSTAILIPSYVTLRGSGMANTIIAGAGPTSSFQGLVGIGDLNGFSGRTIRTIVSDALKGTNSITISVADATITTNSIISIDQWDDPYTQQSSLVFGVSSGGSSRSDNSERGSSGQDAATHHNSQNVKVVAVSNGNKTFQFEPPLVCNFTNLPAVFYRTPQSAYTWNAGLEDLTVSNTYRGSFTSGTRNNIGMAVAANCWLKNVRTVNALNAHVELDYCYRPEIRGCTFTNNVYYDASGGYGLVINTTSGGLFEDNISARTRDWIRLDAASAGNALLYNFHSQVVALTNSAAANSWLTKSPNSGGIHNAHPIMNLLEGNVLFTPQFDDTWGSGSHNTLLRNWIRGPDPNAVKWTGSSYQPITFNNQLSPLYIFKWHKYYNIVGNMLGTASMKTNLLGATGGFTNSRICDVDSWPNSQYATIAVGYYGDTKANSSSWNGLSQWQTFIFDGNYDFVTPAQTWSNTPTGALISNSYFYASAPTNFGALYWPPFNPTNATLNGSIPGLTMETMIPAGWRYAYGTNPPASVLTIAPQHLDARMTNFTTMKVIGTGYANGAFTNLSDLVGFGDYPPNTVGGFYVKTNKGFVIGSNYQWLHWGN